jgi:ABC-type transporter Mla subunit MlaD
MQGAVAGQAINGLIQIEDVEDTARFAFPPVASTDGSSSISSSISSSNSSSSSSNQIPEGLIDQLQTVMADLTAQVEQSNVTATQANNLTQSITESIGELHTSADRAYLFSLIGVGVGTAGIAIGVVALSRREKI